jgi:hypothetical protein
MSILNWSWFCFKRVSWNKERGDGLEYPWGYYRGNEFGLKKMPNWVTLPRDFTKTHFINVLIEI